MTVTPTGTGPQDGGAKTVRTLGLIVIGLVVLCGLLGSCFFVINLILPIVMPQ
jgi:hypothetical protein